ncbi:MAG: hypothetical protein PF437_09280 [Sulfurimonas sp.]|jgi:uncharacterized metal-binding protein YceD (DUF177 family)|nr:hypothetical protein [Sulfurimonas sp.]
MKVTLRKVGPTPIDFEVKSDEITFKGYLQYDSGKLILLKANLEGMTLTECNQCGEEFELPVNEEIKLFISDGVYEDESNIELDVVESFNSVADLDELLNSEIELIKSDYYSCENCKKNNERI